jgi:hypothetical protein
MLLNANQVKQPLKRTIWSASVILVNLFHLHSLLQTLQSYLLPNSRAVFAAEVLEIALCVP